MHASGDAGMSHLDASPTVTPPSTCLSRSRVLVRVHAALLHTCFLRFFFSNIHLHHFLPPPLTPPSVHPQLTGPLTRPPTYTRAVSHWRQACAFPPLLSPPRPSPRINMIFGNEAPFHLKPIPYRGVRKHQAEVLQHPPGYQHPIIPLPPVSTEPAAPTAHTTNTNTTAANCTTADTAASASPSSSRGALLQQLQPNPRERRASGRGGAAYMTDSERLDINLTADDALRRTRVSARQQAQEHLNTRRVRAAAREAALQASRDADFAAEQQRLADVAGTTRKNREQDDRDPITHQCYTTGGKEMVEARKAAARAQYASRQRFLDRQMNSTSYNIITWQPR